MQKRRWLMLAGAVVALVTLVGLAAACGDDDDDADDGPDAADGAETAVDVSLIDFSVNPSDDTVSAGTVTFNATNDGEQVHNLRVIRTDLDPDALPVDDDSFMVDEDQVEVVATFSDLEVGDAEEMSAELESGSYVLICNIATHYGVGMTIGFTVE